MRIQQNQGAGVASRVGEIKGQLTAGLKELRRVTRGSLQKRLLDPAVFRVAPDTDLSRRTDLLRRVGLLDVLKARNEFHNRRDIKTRKATVVGYPETLQIAVTTQCNLRCRMCALTAEGKGYTGRHADPDLFKRIEPILPFVSGIKLQGTGEPFLYPGMKQACELAMKHGVQLITVTNATIIDDEIARMVAPTFHEIFVSMDAASADTYKIIRSGGRLDQVLRGLDFINKHRGPNLRLGLAFTIMRDNVHELPDFVRLAKKVNAQIVRASWMIPQHQLPWTFDQEPTAHPELMARWFAETYAVAEELEMRVELPPVIVPASLLAVPAGPAAIPAPVKAPAPSAEARASAPPAPARSETPATAPAPAAAALKKGARTPPATSVISNLTGRRVKGTCSLMYKNMYIYEDSTVTPCCFLNGRIGSLEDSDFRSIWNGDPMVSLRKEFNDGTLPASCTRCGFLRMGRVGEGSLVEEET
jgi:MoaA/NifB/PqqE/SkfB family radical SAM enzyme